MLGLRSVRMGSDGPRAVCMQEDGRGSHASGPEFAPYSEPEIPKVVAFVPSEYVMVALPGPSATTWRAWFRTVVRVPLGSTRLAEIFSVKPIILTCVPKAKRSLVGFPLAITIQVFWLVIVTGVGTRPEWIVPVSRSATYPAYVGP